MAATDGPQRPTQDGQGSSGRPCFNWRGYLWNALIIGGAAILCQVVFSYRDLGGVHAARGILALSLGVPLALIIMAIPFTWDWMKRRQAWRGRRERRNTG